MGKRLQCRGFFLWQPYTHTHAAIFIFCFLGFAVLLTCYIIFLITVPLSCCLSAFVSVSPYSSVDKFVWNHDFRSILTGIQRTGFYFIVILLLGNMLQRMHQHCTCMLCVCLGLKRCVLLE